MGKPDYALLDSVGLHRLVFYPRQDWTPPPPGATDHLIPVGDDISISCRFYRIDHESPTILYFHGNGEVVCDHDWVAPLYHKIGVNLFVADYRGYGKSGGQPTFADTAADTQVIFAYFIDTLLTGRSSQDIFVMGRSLGSLSAIELASSHPDVLKGMILESGSGNLARLFRYVHMTSNVTWLEDFEKACWALAEAITIPSLMIHGDQDMVIPYDDGVLTYEHIGATNKKLLTVADAGHNDILLVGMDDYFEAIRELVFGRNGMI